MKIFAIISCILILTGCWSSHIIHPIETETRSGQTIIETQIPDTGKRSDLPANTSASDIIAIVNTDTGGKITIKKNEKRTIVQRITGQQKYNYTLDAKAQEEAKEVKVTTGRNLVEAPAPPWWKWPVIIGICLMIAAILYFIRPILSLIAIPLSWLKKK